MNSIDKLNELIPSLESDMTMGYAMAHVVSYIEKLANMLEVISDGEYTVEQESEVAEEIDRIKGILGEE
jgi:hypothetical protein